MKIKEDAMIYIHVPFCERKCNYCDFISFVTNEDVKKAYFSRLNEEIIKSVEFTGKLPVSSIFIGGGTPSCVDERYIYEVLDTVRKCHDVTENAEISMEMNPNSVRENALLVYREAGVNRVSIGLQSANNEELKLLSRLHTYEEFLTAYDNVRNAGFTNVNIDLMSGLYNQTVESFSDTLMKTCALKPEHISAYSLIVEPGTKFYEDYEAKGIRPDEDVDREIYHRTKEILQSEGYERYEISNYSRPGFECRHNCGYWTRKDYMGYGISAASLYKNKRYTCHSDLKGYLEGDFTKEESLLTLDDMMEEFMFLGLRMTKGVKKSDFKSAFSKDIDSVYGKELSKLQKEGLLVNEEEIKLTDKGMDVSNYVFEKFIF